MEMSSIAPRRRGTFQMDEKPNIELLLQSIVETTPLH